MPDKKVSNYLKYAGLDIGSRATKFVVFDGEKVVHWASELTGYDPVSLSRKLMDGWLFDRIIATGYGRHLATPSIAPRYITEIKALVLGARFFYPECTAVIDIGGQDCKVIKINGKNGIPEFEMNDRCAAGSGKFLEVMAHTLGFSLQNFGREALQSPERLKITSTCTVFAESEVISLISKGIDRKSIAYAVHRSIADRMNVMIEKLNVSGRAVFTGGVARNDCMAALLRESLPELEVPDNPEIIGAVGAALEALKQ
ncbi:MAG: acyl-CoA dehydratase activase [Firmicutes bacterium]|nr:acyl-CoA dehydratase activase [Bacillota bacterium]